MHPASPPPPGLAEPPSLPTLCLERSVWNRKHGVNRMKARSGWLAVGAGAMLALAAGCDEKKADQQQTSQVDTAQKQSKDALSKAEDAQSKAIREQKDASRAQQDVQDAQKKLQDAQAKLDKERQEAQQAQLNAQQQTQQAQQQAQQAQQQAIQAQQQQTQQFQQQQATTAEQQADASRQQAMAAQKSGQGSQPPLDDGVGGSGQGGAMANGRIEQLDASTVVIALPDNSRVRLKVGPQTHSFVNGQEVSVQELPVGSDVRASYQAQGQGEPTANRLDVTAK